MADISGYLTNIKNAARGEDVRDSIISALKRINEDNPATVQALSVTANGTYTGRGGIVYNPVTVNVPEGASQSISLSDINITENGEYSPDDGEAYRKIIVEVPQYVNEIMTDPKVIYLEEGAKDYYALDDGYDGYAQVSVVSGGGGGGGGATYTVNFMSADGSTLLQAKTGVPFGGGAVYTGPQPTSPGMRFVGWSPNPLNVKSNMTCLARFENDIWSPTQILDDWVTIAKKVQDNPDTYPIGSWKLLEIPAHYRDYNRVYASREYYDITFYKMELVGKQVDQLEGQNGYAATTWLSKNVTLAARGMSCCMGGSEHNKPYYGWDFASISGYGEANYYGAKYYFEHEFTNAFPTDLLKYVKRVIKYSAAYSDDNQVRLTDRASVNWFWFPSHRELFGSTINQSDFKSETLGPVYFNTDSEADVENRKALNYQQTAYDNYFSRTQSRNGGQGHHWIEVDGTTSSGSANGNTDISGRLGFCL